ERVAVERKTSARRRGAEHDHEVFHCSWMFAARTTLRYISISLRTKRENSSSFIGAGWMPSLVNCSRTTGSNTIALTDSLSLRTISGEVAAGAHMPNHSVTS